MTSPEPPSAPPLPGDLARAVFARVEDPAQAVLVVCNGLVASLAAELAEWIGEDGFMTLLRRALEAQRKVHSSLEDIRVGDAGLEGGDGLDRAALRGALEAVLATVIELLGRFVGVEVATRLAMRAWGEPKMGSGGSR